MRTRNIIIGAALALVSLASCTEKMEYNHVPWVGFSAKTLNVIENVGTVKVDLSAYNLTGPCSVTLSTSGTAKAGENFNILGGGSGVVNFNTDGTQTIEIEIVNHPYDDNGNLSLVLGINSVTEGVEVGAMKSVTINIADFTPVDWGFVARTWNAKDYDGNEYEVVIEKVDETHLTLTNLWDGGETINGTITFDAEKNTASIVFDAFQVIYNHPAYGPIGIFGITGDGSLDKEHNYAALATVSASGITIGPWIALILTGDYAYYSFDDGGETVLTK